MGFHRQASRSLRVRDMTGTVPVAPSCYSIMCTRSQSGQIQVGPLLMPHLFSRKHSGQISNPQAQLQQKGFSCWQQLHLYVFFPRRLRPPGFSALVMMFQLRRKTPVPFPAKPGSRRCRPSPLLREFPEPRSYEHLAQPFPVADTDPPCSS